VGGAEDQGIDPETDGPAHQMIENRDEGFAPFEREALLSEKLAVEQVFEQGRLLQFLQNGALLVDGKIRAVAHLLHSFDEPLAFVGVLDVHELDPDGATVGFAQEVENLAQGRALPEKAAGVESAVQVLLGQAEGLQGKERVIGGTGRERIGAGQQMADVPVAVDQGLDGGLLEGPAVDFRTGGSQLETFEKGPQTGRNALWITAPEAFLTFYPLRAEINFNAHEAWQSGETEKGAAVGRKIRAAGSDTACKSRKL